MNLVHGGVGVNSEGRDSVEGDRKPARSVHVATDFQLLTLEVLHRDERVAGDDQLIVGDVLILERADEPHRKGCWIGLTERERAQRSAADHHVTLAQSRVEQVLQRRDGQRQRIESGADGNKCGAKSQIELPTEDVGDLLDFVAVQLGGIGGQRDEIALAQIVGERHADRRRGWCSGRSVEEGQRSDTRGSARRHDVGRDHAQRDQRGGERGVHIHGGVVVVQRRRGQHSQHDGVVEMRDRSRAVRSTTNVERELIRHADDRHVFVVDSDDAAGGWERARVIDGDGRVEHRDGRADTMRFDGGVILPATDDRQVCRVEHRRDHFFAVDADREVTRREQARVDDVN